MKKKLLSLLVICIMVLSSFTVSFAEGEAHAADPGEYDGIAKATGTEAIAQIGSKTEKTIFLDLRAAVDYAAGHIKGTTSAPVCLSAAEGYAVPLANEEAFIAQMTALNIDNYDKIYLHCYKGTFCVDYAAEWLADIMGISETKLVRVLGGTWDDPTVLGAASNQRTPNDTFADPNRIIIDVRANEVQDAAYLPEAIHQPLFKYVDGASTLDGNQTQQDNFVTFANNNAALLKSKNVYILCNSGSKGAEQATKLLAEKCGISTNVYTIEGGAKAIPSMLLETKSISGTDAVASIDSKEVSAVIIDVRTKANYDKGHLKGALNIPVFGTGVSNGYDDLANAFLAGLEANKATIDAKENIYIICNSGQSGARVATKLLVRAGYSNDNIYTVTGGNKGTDADKSVPTNSTYVSADQAVSVIGNNDYVIIDVRATKTVEASGSIKGSVLQPLFVIGADGNPALTGNEKEIEAFNAYVEANKATLAGKTIYILCNSGSRGALKATELLAAKDITNVFTIDGGAKNQAIKDAFAGNTPAPAPTPTPPSKPTSPVTGETLSTGYILLMLALVVAFVSKKRFA